MTMTSGSLKWQVDFFQDARGEYPVKVWMAALPVKDRARIARTIDLLEMYGTLLRMPHCKHVQGKIWELRIAVGRRDYRVLYFAAIGRRFILLHSLDKKTTKIPKGDLGIAERRMREYQAREERGSNGQNQ